MKGIKTNDFLDDLFEDEFEIEEKKEELRKTTKKVFKDKGAVTDSAKNTKLYELFGFTQYTKNVEVLEEINKKIMQTNYSHSNAFVNHLATYQFFENFRNTADSLEVTIDDTKAFLGVMQQESNESYCILDKYKPFLKFKKRMKILKEDGTEMYKTIDNQNHTGLREFLIIEKIARNNNLKMSSLTIISDFMNDEFEEYLEYFNLYDFNENKITIFSDFENINTNLKNLVIVKNNAEALAALKFKMMKDNKTLKKALTETNFISVNGNDNLYKKAEDIAFFADFTKTKNIFFAVKNLTLSNNIKEILTEIKTLKYVDVPILKDLKLGNRSFVQKVRDMIEKNNVNDNNIKTIDLKNSKKEKSLSISLS